MTECVQDKEFSMPSASQYFTWMTPPPLPPDRNCSGSCNAFPSQSIITTSSSVHAGLAIYKQLKLGRCEFCRQKVTLNVATAFIQCHGQ